MKVIICQFGARHRYAIPEILHQSGTDVLLYTDSCSYSPLGRAARYCAFLPVNSIRNLAQRVVPLPPERVACSDIVIWRGKSHDNTEKHRLLSRKMIHWGVQNADIVYSMYDESLDFLRFAKAQGLKIVVDAFISPMAEYLETVAYHDPNAKPDDFRNAELTECFQLADRITCPSRFVADGIARMYPEHTAKVRICPYGTSIGSPDRINVPQRGRFFWAGYACYRKGLHLFADAAREVKSRYPEATFSAAGITDRKLCEDPRFAGIHFPGKLSGSEMKEQFLVADAFVLPTIAEGMASVCVEALSVGCPLIVPSSAGIDQEGEIFPGILLSELTAAAVAKAMIRIMENPRRRQIFSRQAIRQSSLYSPRSWGRRVRAILSELTEQS